MNSLQWDRTAAIVSAILRFRDVKVFQSASRKSGDNDPLFRPSLSVRYGRGASATQDIGAGRCENTG
jgi:hypothetical protein